MKILSITHEYPPYVVGGMAYHAKNLAESLASLGHEVHVLTSSHEESPSQYIENDVNIHRIKTLNYLDAIKKFNFMFRAKSKAKKLDKKFNFDIIQSHGNSGAFIDIVKPVVMKCHSLWIDELKLPIKQNWIRRQYMKIDSRLQKKMIKKADLVISVSEMLSKSIEENFDRDSKVIHNGVPESMHPLDVEKEKIVLMVSVFSERKGCDMTPELVETVAEQGYKLMHIGPISDESLFENVKEEVKSKGHLEYFQHKDFVQQDELPKYYSKSALLIHPSLYEPFGNTPLEAVACGTPALVSDNCGCAELSQNIKTLYTSGVSEFNEELKKVLRKKEDDRYVYKRSWDEVGEQTIEFFNRIS